MIKNVEEIFKNCLYINLEHRKDRKEHIEKEFTEKLKFQVPERFNAIQNKYPCIGCSLSHLKCLMIAKQRNWEYVVIVEDDICFLEPEIFKNNTNKFLQESNIDFDVLLLAGNNFKPYQMIHTGCVQVYNCQTTTGYIVKQKYYDTLINNIKQGVEYLIKQPYNHRFYAIDIWWKQLQKKDNWYLLLPLTVCQKEGYSDIEQRNTNYKSIMLKVDK